MNPVMCSDSGCLTGNPPMPSSVVPTGAAAASATDWSWRSAWLRITPWPERMTGRSAPDSASAACLA